MRHDGRTAVVTALIPPQPLPIPIFVVGMTRSGTKWLSNLLSSHDDVASVQNERHRGILETSIFDASRWKFDLESDDDFAAFLELWSRSDFFRAAGSDWRLFQDLPRSQRDYLSLFEILMNDLARRRGCLYWLQKLSPHLARPVLLRFPTARTVIVKRRFVDVLRSQSALQIGQNRSATVYQTAYDYVFQEKHIARIRRQFASVAYVAYEDMLCNTDVALRDICCQLGLNKTSVELWSDYRPNTSFSQSSASLSRRVEFTASAVAAFLRLTPIRAMEWFSAVRRATRGRRAVPYYSGEFGLLKDKLQMPPPKEAV